MFSGNIGIKESIATIQFPYGENAYYSLLELQPGRSICGYTRFGSPFMLSLKSVDRGIAKGEKYHREARRQS